MNTLESWPDNPFWDFSIDFYGRDGVEERLLLLQEKLHVDVNLVLYCCWAGYIGAPFLTESDVNNVLELIKAWQKNIVQPLRALRSKLKNNFIIKQKFWSGEIRKKIKLAELDAERLEQLILYQEYSLTGDRNIQMAEKCRRAKANVALYINCLNRKPNSKHLILIDELLARLFD